MRSRTLALFALLPMLAALVACRGTTVPTATATSPPPTATVSLTDTPRPTATPTTTDTPTPTDTPTSAPTKTPEATPTPVARFEGTACPFKLPEGQVEGETVECGYLVVPEDRAHPGGPNIRLAVAVFHPPGGATEADPIVLLSGGPGASDLEYIWITFDGSFAPLLVTGRDVIVFDQRGAGLSKPALDCPRLVELSWELLDNELDGVQLTEQEMFDLGLETALDCADDLRAVVDLSAYNSAANAADVNDLRLALGYDQVNLWGVSYGTRLALEVMRDHPQGLRSVVLDSVYPPDVDLYLEGPANNIRAFDILFAECAADQACNAAYPDLRTVFFSTVDRLEETPATFQIIHPFGGDRYDALMDGDDFASTVLSFLGVTDVLPSVPQMIYQASQGHFYRLASILALLKVQEEAMSQGMYYAVQCHDEYPFTTPEAFEQVLAQYPEWERVLGQDSSIEFVLEVCAGWDVHEADASANQAVFSDIPTLVLVGEYDPTTPPAWGKHAAQTLENSYFYQYPGIGHGVSSISGCPQDMMIAFLNDPSQVPDDTCLAAMGPPEFVLPTQAGEIVLEPFVNDDMDIGGVVPAGWAEIGLGTFLREAHDLDVALLVALSSPMSADELLPGLAGELGLAGTPESVGEREANRLTWSLYAVEVEGLPVDMALAESDGRALLVVLQSEPAEHDTLYDSVFLPVVDALVPLAQPAADVGAAFMAALAEANYARAYGLCAPDLQAEFGSAEALGEWIETHGIIPIEWSFPERNPADNLVQLVGTATFSGDQVGSVEMVLTEVGGEWRVAGFHVQ